MERIVVCSRCGNERNLETVTGEEAERRRVARPDLGHVLPKCEVCGGRDWKYKEWLPPELPASHLAVLEAMTRPDPRPPHELDSPGAAIHRRLPSVTSRDAAEILLSLNALGLTNAPSVHGMTTPIGMANLRQWITPEGWKALGMEADSGECQKN